MISKLNNELNMSGDFSKKYRGNVIDESFISKS